jgi:parvulin-like peptidyl-prolyl isomerase
MKLKKVGDISEPFASKKGDCYYIVKLTEKKDDKVRYESIRISFSHLDSELKQLRDDGKVKELINVTEGETVGVSDDKQD